MKTLTISKNKVKKTVIKKPKTKIEVGTFPVELVFLTLPYKSVKENYFVKTSKEKNLKLIIDAQSKEGKNYGVPFGIYPRLMLYYICSEVKRTNSPRIKLGDNFKEILDNLRISSFNEGKTDGRALSNFKDQFLRLFNSSIQISEIEDFGYDRKITQFNVYFAKGISFWEKSDEINYELELTTDFFNYIKESNSTIFNYDLIPLLKNSPVLLDLYIFLNYKAFSASNFNKDIFVPYKELYEQFGTQSEFKEFTRLIKDNLEKLIKIHGGLILEKNKLGIIIKSSSKPSIEKKQGDLFQLIDNTNNID